MLSMTAAEAKTQWQGEAMPGSGGTPSNPAMTGATQGQRSLLGAPGAETIDAERFWSTDADILVVAAMENQITAANAGLIRARLIVEGANEVMQSFIFAYGGKQLAENMLSVKNALGWNKDEGLGANIGRILKNSTNVTLLRAAVPLGIEIFGGIFANGIVASDSLTVHYDDAILDAAANCTPPTGCDSCNDCNGGGCNDCNGSGCNGQCSAAEVRGRYPRFPTPPGPGAPTPPLARMLVGARATVAFMLPPILFLWWRRRLHAARRERPEPLP